MLRELFTSAMVALASMIGPLLAQIDATSTPSKILAFETMYAVESRFAERSLLGLRADDLPWKIQSAAGSLDTAGRLVIAVRGLAVSDEASVPLRLRGTNDADEFRGAVSCVTESAGGLERTVVYTEGFEANESGDANIDAAVALPDPCMAPVVFVMPADEPVWFAVTASGGHDRS